MIWRIFTAKKLFATVITDNIPAGRALGKIGFRKNIEEDAPILGMEVYVDKEEDTFYVNYIEEYVLNAV